MTSKENIAKKHGYEIIRGLPHQSAKDVLLARKNQKYFILKWPGNSWQERRALEVWQGGAAPDMSVFEDALVLEYFSGRNPFYWQEESLPKLISLLKEMEERQPESLSLFAPLERLLQQITTSLEMSSLGEAKEAISSLQAASQNSAEKRLIHGNLHHRKIFLRDRANLISPLGVQGDPGFDLAFLASSLANDQEEFLAAVSKELSLQSASSWLPGLAVYRLEIAIRKQEKTESRIFRRLVEKLWGS